VQERQFPESHPEALAPAERRVLQRARARRVQGLGAGVGAALLALFVIGCPEPADLKDPDFYPKPPPTTGGSASTGGSGTGGSAGPSCEVACVNDIFQTQATLCKICHGKLLKSSMLNLEDPGYTARLKDVPAVHGDLGTGMTAAADCPKGDMLIDSATPANSWLLKKIHGEQGNCGTPMPAATPLNAAQKTCIETYVTCVAGGAAPAGTAGAAASGTAGAGTAGAGTAGAGTAGSGGAASTGGNGGAGGK
jgi:hypothetical protein